MTWNQPLRRPALLLIPATALYSSSVSWACKAAKADAAPTGLVHTEAPAAADLSVHERTPATANSPAIGLERLLSKLLGPNDFASGGLFLMLIGAAAAGARSAGRSAMTYCKRHVMVRAEIDSRDAAYKWVMHWLSQHPKFRNSTQVSVITSLEAFGGTANLGKQTRVTTGLNDSSSGGTISPPAAYVPALGDHLLQHQGKWMHIHRARNTTGQAQYSKQQLETLTISMLGTSRTPLDALITEAADSYEQSQSDRTGVHCASEGYWLQVGSRPKRPLRTVVLPPGQAESLLSDCAEFLGSEQWYAHHGIPYRRGYLLHGPPGTGKTSLVMALAGALGLDIHLITLSSPSMTDDKLSDLLNTAGERSILLLEDVDAAFVDRTAAAGAASSRLTFSGLLNAIDGVAAQEGRLLFMTTNHIERLSNALIRPGRVDVRCYLGPATKDQAKSLFVSFYRDLPHLHLQPDRGRADGQTAMAAAAAAAPGHVVAVAEGVAPADLQDGGSSVEAQQLQQQRFSGKQQGGDQPEHAAEQASAAESGRDSGNAETAVPGEQLQPPQQQQQHWKEHQQPRASCLVSAAASAHAETGTSLNRESILEELAARFADQLPDATVSMAHLQGYLMTYKADPWAAAANVQQVLTQQHHKRL